MVEPQGGSSAPPGGPDRNRSAGLIGGVIGALAALVVVLVVVVVVLVLGRSDATTTAPTVSRADDPSTATTSDTSTTTTDPAVEDIERWLRVTGDDQREVLAVRREMSTESGLCVGANRLSGILKRLDPESIATPPAVESSYRDWYYAVKNVADLDMSVCEALSRADVTGASIVGRPLPAAMSNESAAWREYDRALVRAIGSNPIKDDA